MTLKIRRLIAEDLCYYCATDRPRRREWHTDKNGNPACCSAWPYRAK